MYTVENCFDDIMMTMMDWGVGGYAKWWLLMISGRTPSQLMTSYLNSPLCILHDLSEFALSHQYWSTIWKSMQCHSWDSVKSSSKVYFVFRFLFSQLFHFFYSYAPDILNEGKSGPYGHNILAPAPPQKIFSACKT